MELLYKNRKMLKIKKGFIQTLLKRGGTFRIERFLLQVSKKLLLLNKLSCYRTLLESVKKIRVPVGLKRTRLKGLTYRIPVFFSKRQQVKVSLHQICSNPLRNKSMISDLLMQNLLHLIFGQSGLLAERCKLLKVANRNKVFAHYR